MTALVTITTAQRLPTGWTTITERHIDNLGGILIRRQRRHFGGDETPWSESASGGCGDTLAGMRYTLDDYIAEFVEDGRYAEVLVTDARSCQR